MGCGGAAADSSHASVQVPGNAGGAALLATTRAAGEGRLPLRQETRWVGAGA